MNLALEEGMATRIIERTESAVADSNFQSLVLEAHQPVLVCFCRTADELDEAMLARLGDGLGDRVRIVRAKLHSSPRAAMKLGVVMTPSYLLFVGGQKRAVAVGSLGPEDLQEYVERALS